MAVTSFHFLQGTAVRWRVSELVVGFRQVMVVERHIVQVSAEMDWAFFDRSKASVVEGAVPAAMILNPVITKDVLVLRHAEEAEVEAVVAAVAEAVSELAVST